MPYGWVRLALFLVQSTSLTIVEAGTSVVSTAIVGSETRQALLFESMSDYVSPVARVNTRTQESQSGHNGLSWFGPIGALRLAADDPYTQKHPKLGGGLQ